MTPLTMPAETGSDQTSWLPLLGVQRRSHSRVYTMQANEYATSEEALAASRAASDRLRGATAKRIAKRPPEPEPEPAPVEPAFIITYVEPPPLNMLAPCSWRFLLAYTALQHGLLPEHILSATRAVPVAKARHDAIYIIAKHTTKSLLSIARLFGRDHTTILASLRKYPKLDRDHLGYLRRRKPVANTVMETVQ